jgi:ParB-like chromosome segregation protein Spo0J
MTTTYEMISSNTSIDLSTLRAAERNANKFEPERFASLKEAIRLRGFIQPILVREVDDGLEIVDGHHRTRAVHELNDDAPEGWTALTSIPVVRVRCSEQEAARLAIAMNRLRGDLDLSEVGSVFAALLDSGVDMALLEATGFTTDEMDSLLESARGDVEDVMGGAMFPPQGGGEKEARPVLEIDFEDAKDIAKAKRALRKVAGKGRPLGEGLMKLLGDDAEGTV